MLKKKKTLDSIAPRQSVKLLVNGKTRSVITQGWRYGNLMVIPESNFHLCSWMIVHIPTGIPILSSKYSCVAFSHDNHKICAVVESVRVIASLLNRIKMPDEITEDFGIWLCQLFKEAGISRQEI